MLTLSGIAIVILGFALRFNPLLVVVVAGIVTGLAGGLSMEKILVTFGDAFVKNRYLSLFLLVAYQETILYNQDQPDPLHLAFRYPLHP